MKITINYESSWRNSFLDGCNNKPLPQGGRNFIGSMTELKKKGNYIPRKVEFSTVMGLLNRLIGDQRKLYQSRSSKDYYFSDIESLITFDDQPRYVNNEVVYVRNMKGSYDQNSFTGMIKTNDPIFTSDYSMKLWGVLSLDFDNLCQFIIDSDYQIKDFVNADPVSVISFLEKLNKEKPVEITNTIKKAHEKLLSTFENQNYLNPKGLVKPITFYCSALYLQLDRLEKRFNVDTAKTKNRNISGISKRGFTKKDFMDCYTTGKKKRIWGNPYMKTERIKGEGEVTSILSKASGELIIDIGIDTVRANELKNMIDNAGVSSFYLGKKGLAYVSDIRI